MDWNPNYRYKMLGKLIHANGEYLIAFDLTATEVYQREIVEGKKPKNAKTPVFPAEWQNQFGMPFMEHRKSMQISTFDGYAIYAIKEKSNASTTVDIFPKFNNFRFSSCEIKFRINFFIHFSISLNIYS